MLRKPLSLGLIHKFMFALLVVWTNAYATPTEYQIAGTGSGSIGGTSFSNQIFDIFLIGDPSINPTVIDPLSNAKISVADIGVTTLNIPTRLGLAGNSAVYFSRSGSSGSDLFDFYVNGLPSLNGPFSVTGTGVFALYQFVDVPSSLGAVTFNSSSDVIFSAAPVPEPETYAMMLVGLGLMGFMVRRKKTA